MDLKQLKWTRPPQDYRMAEDRIEITTDAHTDLWQRTYYHFRNDNAPVLQMETEEKYFSFISGLLSTFPLCRKRVPVMMLDRGDFMS